MRIHSRRIVHATVAGVLALGGSAFAADPTQQELQAQIQELQAKVASLETKQAATTKEIDETVAAIIRDADHRSQLMSMEGFTAGYTSDKGFILQSSDSSFLLHPYLQMQARYESNYRGNGKTRSASKNQYESDSESGFEMRRVKLGFEGTAYTDLAYQFQWAVNRKTGALELEDAWARYKFADTWAVRAGQFKNPFAHESLVSSMKQLAVDRSLLSQFLAANDNYVEGASLIYDNGDRLKAEVAFTNGWNSANSNFVDPTNGLYDSDFVKNNNRQFDWGVAGRVEYLVLGDPKPAWKEYSDFTAQRNTSDMLVVGMGHDLSQSGDTNQWSHTFDVQWEPESVPGLGVYAAYIGRLTNTDTTNNPYAANNKMYSYGFLAQVGYMVNKQWEPFVRFDYTRLDTDLAGSGVYNGDIAEFTAGVNYYLKGNNAKITADISYLPNGSPTAQDGIGVLSQPTMDSQLVGRLQFQLVL